MADGLKQVGDKLVPAQVQELLLNLLKTETSLGHLPPETWAVTDLHRRVNDPQFPLHATQLEEQSERLFGEICSELQQLGFSAQETATVVNSWVHYPGGPKYCDASEVSDALSD